MYNDNKKIKRIKGLSLLEILIAIFIIGILAAFSYIIISNTFRVYESELQESELSSNIQIILDQLTREIRQGIEVTNIGYETIGAQVLGYLSINLSSGESKTYSFALYDGKYYITVDGEILGGPLKEIKYDGYNIYGTYTLDLSSIRAVSITLTMENGKKYSSYVVLRGEKAIAMKIYISEIMYYPATTDKNGINVAENLMEFVVISNDTSQSINLYGWKINGYSITTSRSGTFTLSPGMKAIIGVQNSNLGSRYNIRPGYILLEVNSNYLGPNNSSLNNNSGSVVLNDNMDKLIDQVNYSSSMGGSRRGNNYYSLYRFGEGIWGDAPFLNYSRGGLQVFCLKAPVIITEIMYYPTIYGKNGTNYNNERNMEFIELKNISDQTINIGGWRVITNDNTLSILVSGSWNIPPRGYVIIGASSSVLNDAYNLALGSTYVKTRRNGLAGRNTQLNNTSQNVIIMDANGAIVDQVNYSYTWGGRPIIGSTYSYFSLVRKEELAFSNDPNNWENAKALNYSIIILNIRYNVHCTPGGP